MSKTKPFDRTLALAEYEAVFNEEVRVWLEKHGTREAIADRVHRMLDDRCGDVVSKLLGFTSNWSRWEVDNCNGRSGNSAAGDFLRKHAGEAVNDWLRAQAKSLPNLNAQAVKSLRSEYQETLRRRLSEMLRNAAHTKAADMVQSLTGTRPDEDSP